MAAERPDLLALDLLVRVGELGSVGAAARALGTTQPHASRILARLERQLGLVLLERTTRGSRLTTEGTVLCAWAREALAGVDRVVVGARSLAGERRPHLAVAASLTIAEHLAPAWLARFRVAEPGLRVSLDVRNSHEVIDAVLSGGVPLGFVEAPRLPRSVGSTVVAHDELVVVVAPGHAWARRRTPVTAAELAATPLLVREAGSGTRDTLARALGDAGLVPAEPELELASTAAVKAAVAAGAAPAVLSDLAVQAELSSGALRRVEVTGLSLRRPLHAVWPRGQRPTGPAAALVALARRGGAAGSGAQGGLP